MMQPHFTNILFFGSNLKGINCNYHLETLHNILFCKLSHEIEIHYIQVITQSHFARRMLPSCYYLVDFLNSNKCFSLRLYSMSLSALGFSLCIKKYIYFYIKQIILSISLSLDFENRKRTINLLIP